ncbi:MAG: cytochrome B, partial [Bacteroidia bacterium]|nr:cytochrome B [Bacteroidia bacterium]
NRASLYLLIFTHLQLVVGFIVYFVSPWVRFDNTTMKDAATRYWTVEHVFAMLIVVALITIGRVSSKRLASDEAKHRRLFILNTVALLLIIATLSMSGRGLFGVTPQ